MIKDGIAEPPKHMYVATGCAECNQTGYKGRVGVYELLVMNETLREAVRSTAQVSQVKMLARASGMKTMREDGLDKVVAGLTTLDEILRVVPRDGDDTVCCLSCGHALVNAFKFCPFCGSRRTAEAGELKLNTSEYVGEVLQ